MEWAYTSLAAIAGSAGVGAFLDFLLSKDQHKKLRGMLETFWLIASDVRWFNVGRKEAEFALGMMDQIVGPRFLSVRRIAFIGACLVLVYVSLVFVMRNLNAPIKWLPSPGQAISYITYAIMLSVSLSANRALAAIVARFLGNGPIRNIAVLGGALVATWMLLVALRPFFNSVVDVTALILGGYADGLSVLPLERLLFEGWGDRFLEASSQAVYYFIRYIIHPGRLVADYLSDFTPRVPSTMDFLDEMFFPIKVGDSLSIVSAILRVALLSVFFLGVLLRPLQDAIMLIFVRVIESEKPLFTMVFGGAAAFAKGVEIIIGVGH
jgi:hypothetical protein